MRDKSKKIRSGVTLVELCMSMLVASIVMLVIGTLVVGSAKGWQQNYDIAHKKIKEQATTVSLAFANIGRRSNMNNYVVYVNTSGSTFVPAVSATPSVETVVSGDAVEFRYWDVELDSSDSQNLMDFSKTATVYALFYLQNGKLKVDYGPYPPGGIPAGGGTRNTANIKTVTLAENVTVGPGCGAFSHTMLSGAGKGCVRINVVLTDPNDGQQIRISNSVLLRNRWPR
jgi:hypothetical protein